jgi:hypothetical protein
MLMGAKPRPRQGGGTAHQASGELRAEDDDRPTALRWAVTGCHKQVVQDFSAKKADISHVATDGINPPQRAVLDGMPQ